MKRAHLRKPKQKAPNRDSSGFWPCRPIRAVKSNVKVSEAAAQYAHQYIQVCEQWGDKHFQAIGYGMLAWVEHAQCNPAKALEAMRAAEQLASEYPLSPALSIWVKSSLARLRLAQGNLASPSHLMTQSGITIDDDIPYLREPECLVLLRALLAQGDHDTALALSARLLKPAEAARRMGRVIEILVLQALAFQAKKDHAQALSSLASAISLAQPEEYVRVFLDEGEPIARLFVQAKGHGIGYAAELLAAMGGPAGVTSAIFMPSWASRVGRRPFPWAESRGSCDRKIGLPPFSPAVESRPLPDLFKSSQDNCQGP